MNKSKLLAYFKSEKEKVKLFTLKEQVMFSEMLETLGRNGYGVESRNALKDFYWNLAKLAQVKNDCKNVTGVEI